MEMIQTANKLKKDAMKSRGIISVSIFFITKGVIL